MVLMETPPSYEWNWYSTIRLVNLKQSFFILLLTSVSYHVQCFLHVRFSVLYIILVVRYNLDSFLITVQFNIKTIWKQNIKLYLPFLWRK